MSESAVNKTVRTTVSMTVISVVLITVGALLADTACAARAEHFLARSLLSSPTLDFEPEVTLSGFPFITHARDGEFSGVGITARGVAVPGCEDRGGCRADLGATSGTTTVDDGWRFDADDVLRTTSLTSTILLDSVNLGRLLGILDLGVNTPAPEGRAGAGGPGDGLLSRESGVLLTGTVPIGEPVPGAPPASTAGYPGPKARVSVVVDLTVVDGRLRITATDFYTGPEEHAESDVPTEHRDAVLARFSATLPAMPMAWDVAPRRAYSQGSDIVIEGSDGPRELTPSTF